jgi:hypothetical protein
MSPSVRACGEGRRAQWTRQSGVILLLAFFILLLAWLILFVTVVGIVHKHSLFTQPPHEGQPSRSAHAAYCCWHCSYCCWQCWHRAIERRFEPQCVRACGQSRRRARPHARTHCGAAHPPEPIEPLMGGAGPARGVARGTTPPCLSRRGPVCSALRRRRTGLRKAEQRLRNAERSAEHYANRAVTVTARRGPARPYANRVANREFGMGKPGIRDGAGGPGAAAGSRLRPQLAGGRGLPVGIDPESTQNRPRIYPMGIYPARVEQGGARIHGI